MKKFFTLFLIAVIFFSFMNTYAEEYFPMLTYVLDVNKKEDKVTCMNKDYKLFTFEGAEGWDTGDLANLLIMRTDTEDIIIGAFFEGHIEPLIMYKIFNKYSFQKDVDNFLKL